MLSFLLRNVKGNDLGTKKRTVDHANLSQFLVGKALRCSLNMCGYATSLILSWAGQKTRWPYAFRSRIVCEGPSMAGQTNNHLTVDGWVIKVSPQQHW